MAALAADPSLYGVVLAELQSGAFERDNDTQRAVFNSVTIETSGDITPTIGSHALLLQMTTNLVHNAIVHNLPENGAVQVTTAIGPESVMLTVENTGDKLTPQLVTTLTEPFQRGTERIHSDHAGVGAAERALQISLDRTAALAVGPLTGKGILWRRCGGAVEAVFLVDRPLAGHT